MGTPGTTRTACGPQRGFTLIELMTTVAIVGVLAGLGIYGMRKYIAASRTAEAGEMINSIKSAQETYRTDAMAYLDVSGAHAVSSMSSFYPSTAPGNFKTQWGDTSTDIGKRWKALNVRGDAMFFAYACSAGQLPTDAVDSYDVDSIWTGTALGNWPPASFTGGPWYVVKVVGNMNGDKKRQLWVTANFTDQIFNNNDTE